VRHAGDGIPVGDAHDQVGGNQYEGAHHHQRGPLPDAVHQVAGEGCEDHGCEDHDAGDPGAVENM